MGFGRREWLPSMPETNSASNDESAPSDLISFLKAIPDGRFRRGVRYPQWFLLLVALPPLPGKLTPLHPDHFHHQGA